jgi:hypothetical protein
MSYVGINIGVLTINVVSVQSHVKNAKVMAHQGRPLVVLEQLLPQPEFAGVEYFGVFAHLGRISEFVAIQRACEVGVAVSLLFAVAAQKFGNRPHERRTAHRF